MMRLTTVSMRTMWPSASMGGERRATETAIPAMRHSRSRGDSLIDDFLLDCYPQPCPLCWNREKVREAHHSRYSAMKLAWKTATWQTDMALTEALS